MLFYFWDRYIAVHSIFLLMNFELLSLIASERERGQWHTHYLATLTLIPSTLTSIVALTGGLASLVVLIKLITSRGPHINSTRATTNPPPISTLTTTPFVSPRLRGSPYNYHTITNDYSWTIRSPFPSLCALWPDTAGPISPVHGTSLWATVTYQWIPSPSPHGVQGWEVSNDI